MPSTNVPHIVVECPECSHVFQVGTDKLWVGRAHDGSNFIYLDYTCPKCGEDTPYLINDDA